MLVLLGRLTWPAPAQGDRIQVRPEWITTSSYVWDDVDGDGAQGPGEPPVAGVTVRVYAVGVPTPLSVGLTDNTGRCRLQFQGIPGRYWLWFDAPAGFDFTRSKSGASPFIDSDPGPDGRTVPFYGCGLVKHVDAGLLRHALTSVPVGRKVHP